MDKFFCPNCGKFSYTADTSQSQKCPHCIEKYIIVNNDFMEILKSYNSGNLKLIVNRRRMERRVNNIPIENNRRVSDRRKNNATPIGWLTIKHPSASL